MIITQLVGRLVVAASPRSCFEGTKIYGTSCSSQRIGTCVITSIGDMSPAIMQIPFAPCPFRSAFTTSFTPRLRYLALVAFLTALKSLRQTFGFASGCATGLYHTSRYYGMQATTPLSTAGRSAIAVPIKLGHSQWHHSRAEPIIVPGGPRALVPW